VLLRCGGVGGGGGGSSAAASGRSNGGDRIVVERPCGVAWSQAAAASVTCGSVCAGGARRHFSPEIDCGDLSVEGGGRATGAGGVACGAGVMGCVYCCSLWMALWLCEHVSCLQGARGVQERADRGPSTGGACHVI
jgi:hypothetical protein